MTNIVLHVWSDTVDLRPRLKKSSLPTSVKFTHENGAKMRRLLRFRCVVSIKHVDDIEGRVADINSFCLRFKNELKTLVADKNIGGVFIDVPFASTREESDKVFFAYRKAGLLSIVKILGVGIQNTFVEKKPNKITTDNSGELTLPSVSD